MTDTLEERAELAAKYERGEVRTIVTQEDLEWWYDISEKLEWRYARTYAKSAPHWYIQRERTQVLTLEEYHRALRVIWTFGTPEKFWRKVNIALLNRDGTKKWFTSNMLVENSLINMATTERIYGTQDAPNTHRDHAFSIYDGLGTYYDDRYDNPECAAENREAWKAVMMPTGIVGEQDTLDLGAGTGLALDLKMSRPDKPDLYRAVDPSQAMLNRLVYKHTWVKDVWPVTTEEYLSDAASGRTFDKVISLFGSPSYMEPDTIRAIPLLSRRLVCLMHYQEGYLPDYHTEETAPRYAEESRKAALSLLDDYNGRATQIGKFQVVTLLPEGLEWE